MTTSSARLLRQDTEKKKLLAAFSDYENAVHFISSIESWFDKGWGPSGRSPGWLEKFDRFPEIDGCTPDFVAYFKTPYVLCGEHLKNFRRQGTADVKQVVKYSRLKDKLPPEYRSAGFDVLILVGTSSDDVAAEQLECARRDADLHARPVAPTVVVGYHRDSEKINGEWYELKWRDHHGNCRFTDPNVLRGPKSKGLNQLIADALFCPVQVDHQALTLAGRIPLTNDAPPAMYAAIRIVYPILNSLMTEDERDELQAAGVVEKEVDIQDIAGTPHLHGLRIPKHFISDALDFLVRHGVADHEQPRKPGRNGRSVSVGTTVMPSGSARG